MFFYDPGYMIVMLIGAILVFIPQMWVKSTYEQFRKVRSSSGMTGAEVAEQLLHRHGVHDVAVEMVPGELSDHYDPGAKKVRLSPDNYQGHSVAGVAIAAHEVGHAIQHATGYYPVVIRSAMAPVVNIGSQLGPLLLIVAISLGATSQVMPDWAWYLAWIGVLMFGSAVAFHVVTLPVEINASMRAVKILSDGRFLTTNEMSGARKVLTAAAFTYVAVALYSLIQLLYFVMRLLGNRRD